MATFDVTKKLEIYHTLYRLNRSFAAIVAQCQALEAIRFFPSKSLRNFQGFTQELQAEMNQELLEILHGTELEDWNRYGKVRQAREKELAILMTCLSTLKSAEKSWPERKKKVRRLKKNRTQNLATDYTDDTDQNGVYRLGGPVAAEGDLCVKQASRLEFQPALLTRSQHQRQFVRVVDQHIRRRVFQRVRRQAIGHADGINPGIAGGKHVNV